MSARSQHGMSLIEVLIAVLITNFLVAGLLGLVVMNSEISFRVMNKMDSVNSARLAIERIGTMVRMARNVGELYGYSAGTGIPTAVAHFPAGPNYDGGAGNVGDPNYGNGQMPPHGSFPASPWPSPPYNLSNTCLIVQIPVFDNQYGFPTGIAAGIGSPAVPAGETYDNMDTIVYQVLADDQHPNEYMIQEATFPGYAAANGVHLPEINPARTIVRGITGPLDSTGSPMVFQYLVAAGGTPINLSSATSIPDGTCRDVKGIIVNCEVTSSNTNPFDSAATKVGSQVAQSSTIGIKNEFFVRCNSLATTSEPGN